MTEHTTQAQYSLSIRFKIFLMENKMTAVRFANKLTITPSYLNLILARKRVASAYVGQEIERITNGLIKAEEICTPLGTRCPTCGHKIPD